MKPLADLQRELTETRTTSRTLTEKALARISDPTGEGTRAFIRVFAEQARAAADASDHLRALGIVASPLAGIPISVKDLTDVAGFTTLAGSVVREGEPAAARDAEVLARLRAAGAIVVGTTNMTEFAMGTPGTNVHYGTPKNPWDRESGRIPGGSSSGCAVSITDGMAGAGLGTDTAGSIRVPAALCGLVGFKPTARRIPCAGTFPLSSTLDSVGSLAPSVACCAVMDAVFAGKAATTPSPAPLRGLRLGVLTSLVLDDLEAPVAARYDAALSLLSNAGALLEEMTIAPLEELPELNRNGGFSSMEGFALHRETLARAAERYDPRVRMRLTLGEGATVVQYLELIDARARMIATSNTATHQFDALLMPTCPIVAPTIASLEEQAEWDRVARLLLRNNLVGNFLDRCAITIPCHVPGEAPVGLMVMAETMGDRRLFEIGLGIEQTLNRRQA
jgi:aspartyl-tRNA(Asn)/glutamyl-tRNA(Gln) amidotransferase subunit A